MQETRDTHRSPTDSRLKGKVQGSEHDLIKWNKASEERNGEGQGSCNKKEHHTTMHREMEDEHESRKGQGQVVHLEGEVMITPAHSQMENN